MDSDRHVSERRLRDELVEVGRCMRDRGLVVATEGNLSVRLDAERVLATPAGADKGRLRAADLVEVDLAGRVIGAGRASTELDMHLAIYGIRPDLQAICHAHPPHATAFAAAHRALDACVLPEVVCTLGAVPLSAYGTPSTSEVADAVRAVFADHDACLLRNHGAVAAAAGPTAAMYVMETVERLAQVTWLAENLGGVRSLGREEVDRLLSIRGVYGAERPVPPCRACDD
ncbi:MAG TPA: class II aldolase/adducin family protein [Candidatus Krumholzibacteria bacterium]|nr:class II aldolase/adducin family protein [Candidatus Krumholzibacteria bacterium]